MFRNIGNYLTGFKIWVLITVFQTLLGTLSHLENPVFPVSLGLWTMADYCDGKACIS